MPSDIIFPYRGVRASYYVYHPALDGLSDVDGQWEKCARRFHDTLNDFCGVATLYTDNETRHETVGGQEWKKDVLKLFSAVEKDGKDVYVLEALANVIFDTDEKTAQRMLPYHEELKKASSEIRAEDLNLGLGTGQIMSPKSIVRRGWGA